MRTCSRCGKHAASISPRMKRPSSSASALVITRLAQLVRVFRGEVEPVDGPQRLHLAERRRRERRLAFEGVQHDAFEQVAERQVELGGERLQHFEQTAFQPHARLGTGDRFHWYHVTKVTWYQAKCLLAEALRGCQWAQGAFGVVPGV